MSSFVWIALILAVLGCMAYAAWVIFSFIIRLFVTFPVLAFVALGVAVLVVLL